MSSGLPPVPSSTSSRRAKQLDVPDEDGQGGFEFVTGDADELLHALVRRAQGRLLGARIGALSLQVQLVEIEQCRPNRRKGE